MSSKSPPLVVCVDKCPSVTNYTSFICQYNVSEAANSNVALGYLYLAQQKCMYEIETAPLLNRCIPKLSAVASASIAANYSAEAGVIVPASDITYASSFGENSGFFSLFLANLYNLRGYIFGFGIGVTVGVAFLYLSILRIPYFLFVTIWTIVLGIFVVLIIGSMLLWDLANSWSRDDVHSNNQVITMRVFCYAGIIVSGVYFFLMIVMWKRINLAAGVIQQAAKALAAIPTILLIPIIQAAGVVLFLIPWFTYLLYLASSGEMVTKTKQVEVNGSYSDVEYQVYSYSENAKYIFLFMLFTWFWTSEFIIAVGQLVIALSFAAWYFTRDKATIVGVEVVQWAFKEVGIYHLGTAAFGSLVIAAIKTARAIIAYLQKKAQKSHNKVLEYLMCILGCISWCLEKIMKFINKHAYIITAIYGYHFCHAARVGFFLLLRNILRVAAVNMVSGFLTFIWKFSIPLFVTFLCYLAVAYTTDRDNASDIVAPLVITFFLSFWITSMFIDIFSMGIETILFCFIADEEMFEPEQRFAEEELSEVVHKAGKAHAEAKGKQYDTVASTNQDAVAPQPEGDTPNLV
jgi:hypothetical protein